MRWIPPRLQSSPSYMPLYTPQKMCGALVQQCKSQQRYRRSTMLSSGTVWFWAMGRQTAATLLVALVSWLLLLTSSLGASTWMVTSGGRPARQLQKSFASSQSYSTILAGFPQRALHQVQEQQIYYDTIDSLPSGAISKLPKPAGSNEVCRSVEAQSGDACGLRSWVVAQHLVRSLPEGPHIITDLIQYSEHACLGPHIRYHTCIKLNWPGKHHLTRSVQYWGPSASKV
jgi:hypothetical protein